MAAKGESDILSSASAVSRLENPKLTDIQKEKASGAHLILWLKEGQAQFIELTDGDQIRVKTKGDSPFIGL